jgi:predicted nuclease with TOPRIM domain
MCQTQTQTQTQTQDFFEIYSVEELRKRLDEINSDLKEFKEIMENLRGAFRDVLNFMYYKTVISTETFSKICEKFDSLKHLIFDAIDEWLVNKLQVDTDIEKYERAFNVSYYCDGERQLGVVLLRENDVVKPVVVWTDYKEVGYIEGEKNE